MTRMDPLRLLSSLTELLSINGGIKSTNEVLRFCDLLNKFSKKLVSKIIYLKILGSSSLDVLVKFVESNGLKVLCDWLHVCVKNSNWSLCQEIICVLQLCPVRETRHSDLQFLIKVMNCITSDVTADKSIQISADKVSKLWKELIDYKKPVDQQDFLRVTNICSSSSSVSLLRPTHQQGVTNNGNPQSPVDKDTSILSTVQKSGNSEDISDNKSERFTIDMKVSFKAYHDQTRFGFENKVEPVKGLYYTLEPGTNPASFAMDTKKKSKERVSGSTISKNTTIKTKVKSIDRNSRKRKLFSSSVNTNCHPKRYKQRIELGGKLCFVVFADECYVSIIEDLKKNNIGPLLQTQLNSEDITTIEKSYSEHCPENGQSFTLYPVESKLSDLSNYESQVSLKELKSASICCGENMDTNFVDDRKESSSNDNVSVANEDDSDIDIVYESGVKQINPRQKNHNVEWLEKSRKYQKPVPVSKEKVGMSFNKSEIKNGLNQNDKERIKLMSNSTSKTVFKKEEPSVKVREIEEPSTFKEVIGVNADIAIHNTCLSVDIENIEDNSDYLGYKKEINTDVIPKVNTDEKEETLIEFRNIDINLAIVEEKEVAKNTTNAGDSEKDIYIPVVQRMINNLKVEDGKNDDIKNNNIVSIDTKVMLRNSELYPEIQVEVRKAISEDKSHEKGDKHKLKGTPDIKFKSKSRLVPILRDSPFFSSSLDACYGKNNKSNNMIGNEENNIKDVRTESIDIPFEHVVKENVVLEDKEERKVVGNLVIKHGGGKPKKLRVNWLAESQLVKVRLFEVDVSERTNVARTKFKELRRTEIGKEKLYVCRRWPRLTLLDRTEYKRTEVDVGKNSSERQSQTKREAATLSYLGCSSSPSEVTQDLMSSMYNTIVKLIPLEDTTGHGTVKDYGLFDWKCNSPSQTYVKVRPGLNELINSRPIPILLDTTKKAPCKFWTTVSGCRKGRKCKFLHET